MKGGKRENSGRKVGGKNQRTIEWEQFGKTLLGDTNLQRALQIMDDADDDTFMKHFNALAEYFKPKLARTELTGKDGEDFNVIKVVYEDSNQTPSQESAGNIESE